MRAFWDEVRTLQADYGAAVSLFAYPTDKPSVWNFRLIFTPIGKSAEDPVGAASVQFQYPVSQEVSLTGWLWNQSMKLTQLVTDSQPSRAPFKRRKG